MGVKKSKEGGGPKRDGESRAILLMKASSKVVSGQCPCRDLQSQ